MKTWRWALGVACVTALLAILPTLQVWAARGGALADADASFSSDEVAYCAYINALLDGRPRRADPYTGDDAPAHESLFSIQFVPPYAIVGLARLTRLDAPQVFILLNLVVPFLTALALFWVLYGVRPDALWAATGVLVIICLGSFAVYFGPLRWLQGTDTTYTFAHLPFMRRYVPAVPFPLLWLLVGCAWRAFAHDKPNKQALYAIATGLLSAVLVFSYFYLWTAALAWLAVFVLWWFVARPADRPHLVPGVVLILMLLGAALGFYGWLVAQRAPAMDSVQLLALSHAPDLRRDSVKVGLFVLALLGLAVLAKVVDGRARRVALAAACALAPFVMFNQQIITGRSLQPLHYELYIAKYFALLGLWVALGIFATAWAARRKKIGDGHWGRRALKLLALLALAWGVTETTINTRRYLQQNPQTSGIKDAAQRVHAHAVADKADANGFVTVLYNNLGDADYAPMHAPEAVLWAPHLPAFTASAQDSKERIYHLMYFTGITLDGVDETNFKRTEPRTRYLLHSLIEWASNEPAWTVNWQPLSPTKILAEIAAYRSYTRTFDTNKAARFPLSYVVINDYEPCDLRGLDLWYTREAVEKFSSFTIYRVKLRPPESLPLTSDGIID